LGKNLPLGEVLNDGFLEKGELLGTNLRFGGVLSDGFLEKGEVLGKNLRTAGGGLSDGFLGGGLSDGFLEKGDLLEENLPKEEGPSRGSPGLEPRLLRISCWFKEGSS